jgi:hypothetical protein
MAETGFVKSSPTLLFQRREFKSSPFEEGGMRGIFVDRFEMFLGSDRRECGNPAVCGDEVAAFAGSGLPGRFASSQ